VSIAATSYFLRHGHDEFAIRIAGLAYTLCEFLQIGCMFPTAAPGNGVRSEKFASQRSARFRLNDR